MTETERAPRPPSVEPSIPYAAHAVEAEDLLAVADVLRSDRLAQGPEVERFETALASRCGTTQAVAMSSGTAALHTALAALGVGPGDEVIVPPITFVATCNAVLLCGAKPVFADVEPGTLTLSAEAVAARVGPATRGAIPVHFGGHPADTPALRQALGPDRFVLEDACHALGATLRGVPVGALGDAACFSFHPAKLVTTGEGGALTTSRESLARLARSLREHGLERDATRFEGLGLPAELDAEQRGSWMYEMQRLAPNYRLPELSAALGRSQLARTDGLVDRRRDIAERYREALGDVEALELPFEREGARSAWHLYPVRLRLEQLRGGRAAVFEALRAQGIGVQVHYIPVHLQPYYRKQLGTGYGDHPAAEQAYLRLITLPLFSALRLSEIDRVVDAVRSVLRRLRR